MMIEIKTFSKSDHIEKNSLQVCNAFAMQKTHSATENV